MKHQVPSWMRLLAILAIGVMFAMATSTVNHIAEQLTFSRHGEQTFAASLMRFASYLLDAGWSWAALAVAAGLLAREYAISALAGAVALLGATMEYYVFKSWPLWGGDGSFVLDSRVIFWGGASLLTGPPLGMIGARMRRPGVLGLIAGLVVPAGAALQMIYLPPVTNVSIFDGSAFPEATWARWVVWAAAACGGAYVIVRYAREKVWTGR
ncbi:hypothetical protein [Streptacidiphilus neutrinimicus]|uniref:hypothetical protein n=1 Tax=Streptacidiphilus neutrinimicus TaxID=105420 RepID=UPI00126A4F9B|nr:hypothetical protein [Streptacidiphilus neutrinimicus]